MEELNKLESLVIVDKFEVLLVDCCKMKDKIKVIELYIMKYWKLVILLDE